MKKINSRQPLYQQIYIDLLEKINSGYYKVGEKIPTEKQLQENYNVSRITVKSALQTLADDGYIRRVSGVGTFVEKKDEDTEKKAMEKTLGLLVSGFSDSFGRNLLMALDAEISRLGYSFILKITQETQDLENAYLKEMVSLGVDGIIIIPVQAEYYNPYLLQLILDGFPIVTIDKKMDGIPAVHAGSDHYKAAYHAVSYLIERGHRNICVLNHKNIKNSSLTSRLEGIKIRLSEVQDRKGYRLTIHSLLSNYMNIDDELTVEKDIHSIVRLLEQNPDISCFLTLDYHFTQLVYEAVNRLGKCIPEDYSFLTFDAPSSVLTSRKVSHISQNEKRISRLGVEAMVSQITKKTLKEKNFIVPTTLKDHGTVAYHGTR